MFCPQQDLPERFLVITHGCLAAKGKKLLRLTDQSAVIRRQFFLHQLQLLLLAVQCFFRNRQCFLCRQFDGPGGAFGDQRDGRVRRKPVYFLLQFSKPVLALFRLTG